MSDVFDMKILETVFGTGGAWFNFLAFVSSVITIVIPLISIVRKNLDNRFGGGRVKPMHDLFFKQTYTLSYMQTFILLVVFTALNLLFGYRVFEDSIIRRIYEWSGSILFIVFYFYVLKSLLQPRKIKRKVFWFKVIGQLITPLFFSLYAAMIINVNDTLIEEQAYFFETYVLGLIFFLFAVVLLNSIYTWILSEMLASIFQKVCKLEYNLCIKNRYYQMDEVYQQGKMLVGRKTDGDKDIYFSVPLELENLRIKLKSESKFFALNNDNLSKSADVEEM